MTGEAEIIPVKPDAGNAAVGMSRIFVCSQCAVHLSDMCVVFFNIRVMNGKYISTLTIAGSDSCGGAGIQADIKMMSALGCYVSSVITAVTAQDTCRVGRVMDVPADIVREQLHMVLNDIHPQAVKTGMMSNADIVGALPSPAPATASVRWRQGRPLPTTSSSAPSSTASRSKATARGSPSMSSAGPCH